jgi:hypothetical protein
LYTTFHTTKGVISHLVKALAHIHSPAEPTNEGQARVTCRTKQNRTFGVIQGTFGVIQGTFGVIQGTFGVI